MSAEELDEQNLMYVEYMDDMAEDEVDVSKGVVSVTTGHVSPHISLHSCFQYLVSIA